MRLFDSDNYDSDGDGISNLMERAFGGDSLTNDSKSIMPRSIRKKMVTSILYSPASRMPTIPVTIGLNTSLKPVGI